LCHGALWDSPYFSPAYYKKLAGYKVTVPRIVIILIKLPLIASMGSLNKHHWGSQYFQCDSSSYTEHQHPIHAWQMPSKSHIGSHHQSEQYQHQG
jgi:hypothetical protein